MKTLRLAFNVARLIIALAIPFAVYSIGVQCPPLFFLLTPVALLALGMLAGIE